MDKDLASIQETRNAVKRAKAAQEEFMTYSQERIDTIVRAVADAAFTHSKELAEMAVSETGMGVAEHKLMKNEVGSRAVYESIKNEKTTGVIREDQVNRVTEIAYPFGVIAAIIPTTNPTSTAMYKTLISLKTGNAIVVSPHPRAKKCTVETLRICNEAAVKAGAPEGLIGWISEPTMEATNELLRLRDVDLILATGGGGLVKAAYSSGKPAYGVGPGNVPVYIEKSANVEKSVKQIVDSKTFDYGTICATEQAIIVDESIKAKTVEEFKRNGSHFLNAAEKEKLEQIVWLGNRVNPAIVGVSALTIAEMAGINVPADTRLLIAEESKVGKDAPLSVEILGPIFPLYTVGSQEQAKEISIALLNLGGRGHSFALHTNDDQVVRSFGQDMPVSRFMVNTLSSIGAVGATTGLAPSLTLGCGGYGGNISSDNITARHLINIKRIAYGIKEVEIPRPGTGTGTGTRTRTGHQSTEASFGNVESRVREAIGDEPISTDKIEALVRQVLREYQK